MIFSVIGGDRRQAELARLLAADGNTVRTFGVEGLPETASFEEVVTGDIVLLPLPLCGEGDMLNCQAARVSTGEVFHHFRPEQLLLAGQVKPRQRKEAAGLTLVDYFLREEVLVANAAATAEAAVRVAMDHLDRSLLGMDCLVIGFGRIGRLLADRLRGLGARVTAAARRPADLAWIRAYGWRALETGGLDGHLASFGAVFNTVPSLVLDGPLLAQLPGDCLCVDLASARGIDPETVEDRPYVWARSLPGKLVPRTAAAVLRDAVYHILEERGDTV